MAQAFKDINAHLRERGEHGFELFRRCVFGRQLVDNIRADQVAPLRDKRQQPGHGLGATTRILHAVLRIHIVCGFFPRYSWRDCIPPDLAAGDPLTPVRSDRPHGCQSRD